MRTIHPAFSFLASSLFVIACSGGSSGEIDDDLAAMTTPTAPPAAPAPPSTATSVDTDAGASETCTVGATRSCFPGNAALVGKGACKAGLETCQKVGEFSRFGPCLDAVVPRPEAPNGVDDDCNGVVDDLGDGGAIATATTPSVVEVAVNVNSDCVTVSCPPNAPYPVGCNLNFAGQTPVGCVAHEPNASTVYLKEGTHCDAGRVIGTLRCSSQPGAPLDAQNCPINKIVADYVARSSKCQSD